MEDKKNPEQNVEELNTEEVLPKERKPLPKIVTWAIAALIIAAVVLLAYGILQIRTFSIYSTEKSTEEDGAAESQYLYFQENLLKYNNDGAIYSDLSDHIIWNETYEMATPTVKQSGNYVEIYDRQGTEIHVMTSTGTAGVIQTSLPITASDVSSSGIVAVLMQSGQTGHIELRNTNGDILASGEVHFKNTGYPIAIAISPDSEKLMVAMVSVTSGKVATVVNFYNFGSAGQKEIDNVVSTYTYEGTIIPELDFSGTGRGIAFGTNQIILYDASARPKEAKTITPTADMQTVFYNDNYFGYVAYEENEETGEMEDCIEVYNYRGTHRFRKVIDSNYQKVEFLSDDEVLVTDGKQVSLYNKYGVERFNYTFDNTVYALLPIRLQREYLIVYQDSIDRIRLR